MWLNVGIGSRESVGAVIARKGSDHTEERADIVPGPNETKRDESKRAGLSEMILGPVMMNRGWR